MRSKLSLHVLAAVSALLASSHAAGGQRAFVATTGTDNPNCPAQAPCRTFGAAIAAVAPGGEIVVLDSGGYGAATIGKSVSIVAAPGAYAGVTAFSGDGITIDGAGIDVVLRGLAINGLGGTNGITISNAASVRVEKCDVSNLLGTGIYHTAGDLYVEDTTVHDNAGIGVWSVGAVHANLDRVRAEANLDGVRAQDGARVAVRDSVMSHNAHVGAFAFVGGTGYAILVVTRSQMSFNENGAQARSIVNGPVAELFVTDSTVSGNSQNGLLATSLNSGSAWMYVTRTVARTNLGFDLHVTAGTTVDLDSSNVDELFYENGSIVFTRDNNEVRFPTGGGLVSHLAAF